MAFSAGRGEGAPLLPISDGTALRSTPSCRRRHGQFSLASSAHSRNSPTKCNVKLASAGVRAEAGMRARSQAGMKRLNFDRGAIPLARERNAG